MIGMVYGWVRTALRFLDMALFSSFCETTLKILVYDLEVDSENPA
jgi:hypothetical protein